MKILLTGKNGQLGFELQRALAPLGEVVAVGTQDCNLADADALRDLVRRVAPDVIVNPAAYTAVDKAESDEATAHAVNAVAPAILGEEGAALGALVLHYSTDYVFDGTKQGAYTENDVPAPQSVYGRTKLEGEQGLAAGKTLKATVDAVAPLATEQYPTPARRPLNSRLDTTRFRTTFDLRLPPWQEGVRHVLRQIL
jgi:dTDP-4-dehydrorhamnose reductase